MKMTKEVQHKINMLELQFITSLCLPGDQGRYIAYREAVFALTNNQNTDTKKDEVVK